MTELTPPHTLLAEIEALQDEVLRQLDELNQRVERTLAEFGGVAVEAACSPNHGRQECLPHDERRSAA